MSIYIYIYMLLKAPKIFVTCDMTTYSPFIAFSLEGYDNVGHLFIRDCEKMNTRIVGTLCVIGVTMSYTI